MPSFVDRGDAQQLSVTSLYIKSPLDSDTPPSLSNIPLEVLDKILGCLTVKDLCPFLLSSKSMFSRAVRLQYRVVEPFTESPENCKRLLKTLVSSIRGTSYFSYHLLIEELSIFETTLPEDTRKDAQDLLDATLKSGLLRDLQLVIFDPDFDLELNMDANPVMLTRLRAPVTSEEWRKWLLRKLPKLRLHDLCLNIAHSDWSWDVFPLQQNTLRSLLATGGSCADCRKRYATGDFKLKTSFVRYFVAPHSGTLTTIGCDNVYFGVGVSLSLRNLLTLSLSDCVVERWECMCESLTSLKHLRLFRVQFVGLGTNDILSTLPSLGSLETLGLGFSAAANYTSPWRKAPATSMTNLKELSTDDMPVDTLNAILKSSLKLELLILVGVQAPQKTKPTNKHLDALSKNAPSSLQSLELLDGVFSCKALTKFASSFPPSVKTLDLSGCHGLTPSGLRALLHLPLRVLTLNDMPVEPKLKPKLENISQSEKPAGLKWFKCGYKASTS